MGILFVPKKKQKTKQEAPELSGGRSSATPDVRACARTPIHDPQDQIRAFEAAYLLLSPL